MPGRRRAMGVIDTLARVTPDPELRTNAVIAYYRDVSNNSSTRWRRRSRKKTKRRSRKKTKHRMKKMVEMRRNLGKYSPEISAMGLGCWAMRLPRPTKIKEKFLAQASLSSVLADLRHSCYRVDYVGGAFAAR